MTDYGLSHLRDKDGGRRAVDHTYEAFGREVTIKLIPPTLSQQDEYEKLGEDLSVDRIREILDEHVVEPELPEDLTAREATAYLGGVINYGYGAGSDLAAEVQEELEKRTDGEGN